MERTSSARLLLRVLGCRGVSKLASEEGLKVGQNVCGWSGNALQGIVGKRLTYQRIHI
jgi:hypothetical protein